MGLAHSVPSIPRAAVAISLYIRISLKESPLYAKLKEKGKTFQEPAQRKFRQIP